MWSSANSALAATLVSHLESRGTLCDYDPSEDQLTVYYSGQAPHMMQVIFSKHLGLPEENVRVISNDVGGSFGIKIHTYGDEIATAAAAKAAAYAL